MFVRRVRVKNSICFQIGRKSLGRFVLIKHVGCAPISSEPKAAAMLLKARSELSRIKLSIQPALFSWEESPPVTARLLDWRITGFHRVFGVVYDAIGFPNNLLRDLMIGRIVCPKSKLATVSYLNRYLMISLTKDAVYRFLDRLDKDSLTRIAFRFVSGKHQGVSLVFYDVTTLHFETETEDWWRRKGYSKNHRSDVPQIIVGLFVDAAGFPFDFDMFSGNTFEGHTFETAVSRPVIRKSKYLRLSSPNQIRGLDQAKIAADMRFDGLKGYVANLEEPVSFPQAISQYRNLWKIETAFRMSKTDLKQRPVYHRLRQRIQSHLLVCFCGLLVMKQAETMLAKLKLSLKTAIEILSEVGEGTITIGRTEFPVEKELDQDAKLILNLFKGR